LLYDAPLSNPADDRLERSAFGRYLAEAILRMPADESFVFSLNGPWGSGKTTAINFVLAALKDLSDVKEPSRDDDKEHLVTVQFNPWWFAGSEDLLSQFLTALAAALNQPDRSGQLKKIGEKIGQLAGVLRLTKLIPVLSEVTGPSADALEALGKFVTGAAGAKGIHTLKDEISEALKAQKGRVVVIVDDIDRLSPEKIREVFQVVKAVGDLPRVIYLLAFDESVVLEALAAVHGESGRGYLEKVVQAPIELPPIDRHALQTLLLEQLDLIISNSPERLWESDRWLDLYHEALDGLIRTPRDAKRLVNALRPSYAAVIGEVNVVDFLAIQALRVFGPEIYRFVVTNKNLLCGVPSTILAGEAQNARLALFESVLATAPQPDRDRLRTLLGRLFPQWAAVYGGNLYASDYVPLWSRLRRVCAPDAFDAYFRLSLAPGEVSAAEIQTMLAIAPNRVLFGQELLRLAKERRPDGTTRIRSFLERLEGYTERDIAANLVEPIVRAFLDVGDQLLVDEDQRGALDRPNDLRLLNLNDQLLHVLPSQQQRFDVLKHAITESQALYLVVLQVMLLGKDHGKHTRQPPLLEEYRTVSAVQLQELERIAARRVRASIKSRELLACPSWGSILLWACDLGATPAVRALVNALLKDDEGMADLLGSLLILQHSSFGRRASASWRIDIEAARVLLGRRWNSTVARAKRLRTNPPDWLTDRQCTAVEVFVQEVTSKRGMLDV
jgi:predicted KAP-like P-loop ATPase